MTATALEEFLIEAATHALRGTFPGSDATLISACARLQVLGDRAKLAENEQASCWAMLATFEREYIGRSITFNGAVSVPPLTNSSDAGAVECIGTVSVPPGGHRT